MTGIEGLGTAIGAVAERVGPSVVGIGERWRGGSGVVIAQDRVVTNAHNVGEDGADRAHRRGTRGGTPRGRGRGWRPGGARGADRVTRRPSHRSAASVPSVGTPVVALVRAADGGIRATLGFVSSVDRAFSGPRGHRVSGAIEHTAPLAPGSSGSPRGRPRRDAHRSQHQPPGPRLLPRAPGDAALGERLAALGRGDAPKRRRLGVGLAPGHAARRLRRAVGLPDLDGALVMSVEDGSPAAGAGIAQGDLIVAVGGHPIRGADDLFEALAGEGQLSVSLVRGTEERTVEVAA